MTLECGHVVDPPLPIPADSRGNQQIDIGQHNRKGGEPWRVNEFRH